MVRDEQRVEKQRMEWQRWQEGGDDLSKVVDQHQARTEVLEEHPEDQPSVQGPDPVQQQPHACLVPTQSGEEERHGPSFVRQVHGRARAEEDLCWE